MFGHKYIFVRSDENHSKQYLMEPLLPTLGSGLTLSLLLFILMALI